MGYYKPEYTPTHNILLIKDENKAPRMEPWEYRSVVGMMIYLVNLLGWL